MGYTTDFTGSFDINPPLTPAQIEYINAFSASRRMKRDVEKLPEDPIREAVGLPPGIEGEFFVASAKDGNFGQTDDASVLNHNKAACTQPGLWCQWIATDDGDEIEWDGNEKFYHYIIWIAYYVKNFFEPWGCELNGTVKWRGEDRGDRGRIDITNNMIEITKENKSVERTADKILKIAKLDREEFEKKYGSL